MTGTPWPIYVGIDTSVFEGVNFSYDGPEFLQLKALARDGRVRLVCPEIFREEVVKRIRVGLAAAKRATHQFRKDAKIIANLRLPEFQGAFKRPDLPNLEARLIGKFNELCSGLDSIAVPTRMAESDKVFALYFSGEAPFGDGRKEFPDAFALSSLQQWAISNDTSAHVVSLDKGLLEGTKHFDCLESHGSLAAFLEYIAGMECDALLRQVHDWAEHHKEDTVERAKSEFEYLGFYVDDEEGEVIQIKVDEVDVHDFEVIKLENENAEAILVATIVYDADISYPDPNTGIWDSEDQRWYARETVSKTVERELILTFSVGLRLDPAGVRPPEIDGFAVTDTSDIGVSLYEEEWH